MQKTLLIIVGLICVAAFAAMAVVILHGGSSVDERERPQAPDAEARRVAVQPPPQPVADVPQARRTAGGNNAEDTEVKDNQVAVVSPQQSEYEELRERVKAKVDGMSNEERRVVYHEAATREQARVREAMKSGFQVDGRLYMMTRDHPHLRLTDEQQAQVEMLRETMVPQRDAAIADTRQQLEAVTARFMADSNDAEARRTSLELQFKLIETIRQFDQEYTRQLSEILTSEQVAGLRETQQTSIGTSISAP